MYIPNGFIKQSFLIIIFQIYLQLLALGAGGQQLQQVLSQNPLLSAVLASAATNQQNSPGLTGLPPNEMMQPNIFQSLLLLNSANSQPQMMNPQSLFNSQVKPKFFL
jgi:hypothetical protein